MCAGLVLHRTVGGISTDAGADTGHSFDRVRSHRFSSSFFRRALVGDVLWPSSIPRLLAPGEEGHFVAFAD